MHFSPSILRTLPLAVSTCAAPTGQFETQVGSTHCRQGAITMSLGNFPKESWLIWMRENALPLLEDYGVDLVLSAHSHSYERSYLIDGHYGFSPTFGPEHLVDGGDGRETGDGAYRKPGIAGAPRRAGRCRGGHAGAYERLQPRARGSGARAEPRWSRSWNLLRRSSRRGGLPCPARRLDCSGCGQYTSRRARRPPACSPW